MGVQVVEYDWDFQDDDDEQPIDPRSLPKQLRKVIKDAKAEAKAAKDEAEVLRKENREIHVTNVLKSMGVPEKVAKLIPSDVTSGEAIKSWLSDYSDVFTPSSSTPATQAVTGEVVNTNGQAFIENAATANGMSPEEIANAQRMQATATSGQPFGGRHDELMAKLNDPELTEEQFTALLKAG
jgi:hypothetical protein